MPVPAHTTMHTFKARIEEIASNVITKTIEAAYFVDEMPFTVFKDAQHQAVYAVRSDRLLSVERVALTATAESAR